jgi:hypothetical protein
MTLHRDKGFEERLLVSAELANHPGSHFASLVGYLLERAERFDPDTRQLLSLMGYLHADLDRWAVLAIERMIAEHGNSDVGEEIVGRLLEVLAADATAYAALAAALDHHEASARREGDEL